MDAAQIAGLNCLRLMNETTAGTGEHTDVLTVTMGCELTQCVKLCHETNLKPSL